ncbi:hypothetical protein ACIRJR_07225 [Streptomyces sp. NPDC102402]|uniref:hypothetical protein n=1 Tax=Streptomyces sp. NPDC102402 TaxID=3366169 RepID=UPI003810EB77
MADEQHEWLDADAAEKLLRGESVEPVGGHATTEARRLEAALLALRTAHPAGGELPGEAAVLAAFREASRGGRRAGAASPAGRPGQQDAQHTVRIGPTPAVPVRRPRWTRPVRYGLVVSLAGCALGGVAVAAGTGMLPAPFGGHASPVPATSVSAAATPDELGAEVPDAGESSPLPSAAPRTPGPPAVSDAPDGPDGGAEEDDGRTGRENGAADHEGGARDGGDTAQDGTDGREPPRRSPAEVYKKSVAACRGYREDSLSREEERRLLELADGEANLDRFCDRLLGTGGRGSDEGGPGEDKGDGGADGGKGGGDSEGSLPSVTFRAPSEAGTRGVAPGDGVDPRPTAGPGAVPSELSPSTR